MSRGEVCIKARGGIVNLARWDPEDCTTDCTGAIDSRKRSSFMPFGCTFASESASGTWKRCWPRAVCGSRTKRFGAGATNSGRSLPTGLGEDAPGPATSGTWMRCSSRSMASLIIFGGRSIKTVLSSISWCNRNAIALLPYGSFVDCCAAWDGGLV